MSVSTSNSVYRYCAPWQIYSFAWSRRADQKYRLAIGSLIDQYRNVIRIVKFDEEKKKINPVLEFRHNYPCTAMQFLPDRSNRQRDLIATAGDYLRLHEIFEDEAVATICKLDSEQHCDYAAPLTSLDWNPVAKQIIGCGSIDTTVCIWDIQRSELLYQLIAHDHEVFDLSFSSSHQNLFVTASYDGTARLFDLRRLKNSTIIYEQPEPSKEPLLRCEWCPTRSHYVAVTHLRSPKVSILDLRVTDNPVIELIGHSEPSKEPLLRCEWCPTRSHYVAVTHLRSPKVSILDLRVTDNPVIELIGHSGPINSISWSNFFLGHIATGGEDKSVMLWKVGEEKSSRLSKTKISVSLFGDDDEEDADEKDEEEDAKLEGAFEKALPLPTHSDTFLTLRYGDSASGAADEKDEKEEEGWRERRGRTRGGEERREDWGPITSLKWAHNEVNWLGVVVDDYLELLCI
ncbi:hypothetical protein ADUPG1_012779 [Aduncisulcus paluster]|uniref:Uncharacterized protein n=1 Tax=Aduncisulcus paluster TaxID=2918883 RepID=A0ABQ5K4V4_9EUKA|nr:hypothetical protein ADUPG1_012779 [Aduncisulcus paluster]